MIYHRDSYGLILSLGIEFSKEGKPLMKAIEILLVCLLLFEPWGNLARGQEQPLPTQASQAEEQQTPVATLLTIVNIPARGLLCGASSLLASIFMGASGGRRYADAATMIEESCSGPWIITPSMIEEGQKDKISPDMLEYKQH
jgi:hypothetical protein